jgi:hypothetical protein
MNFATAFDFPDTSDMLGLGPWRSTSMVDSAVDSGRVSPIAPVGTPIFPSAAAGGAGAPAAPPPVQFDMLDDAFCLSEEPEDDARAELINHLRTEVGRLTVCENQFKIENAALAGALQREKERAAAAEADLERLRDYAAAMEEEFNRVRDRALDMIMSRTAEVDRLKKEVAQLTAERDQWKARHATVRESAERLRKERDDARAGRRPLRADAPEFVPSYAVDVPAFMEAPPSFKDAVRARLAALNRAPVPGSC